MANTLTYQKEGHLFVFRYEEVDDMKMREALIDLVNNQEVPFVWFDACVISHRMGKFVTDGIGPDASKFGKDL